MKKEKEKTQEVGGAKQQYKSQDGTQHRYTELGLRKANIRRNVARSSVDAHKPKMGNFLNWGRGTTILSHGGECISGNRRLLVP